MKKISITTRHKTELINITKEVTEAIIQSGITDGIATIATPHTTGAVFLFENLDPNLWRDLLKKLHEIIPNDGSYAHVGNNADAHLKSAIMGGSVTVIVENGKPLLGQWQGIYFGEFDGPRERSVYIKVL
ncbi:MAG: secondary thiamine-phosphate synthase enzyme YjbQ [Campylobacterales bacterium]